MILILDYIMWLTFWCAALVVISGAIVGLTEIVRWVKRNLY